MQKWFFHFYRWLCNESYDHFIQIHLIFLLVKRDKSELPKFFLNKVNYSLIVSKKHRFNCHNIKKIVLLFIWKLNVSPKFLNVLMLGLYANKLYGRIKICRNIAYFIRHSFQVFRLTGLWNLCNFFSFLTQTIHFLCDALEFTLWL